MDPGAAKKIEKGDALPLLLSKLRETTRNRIRNGLSTGTHGFQQIFGGREPPLRLIMAFYRKLGMFSCYSTEYSNMLYIQCSNLSIKKLEKRMSYKYSANVSPLST